MKLVRKPLALLAVVLLSVAATGCSGDKSDAASDRYKNVPVSAVMTASSADRPTPERSISNDPDAIRQLLEDPKFHVLAEVRYRFKEHLIVEIEIAIAAAEAILSEIEKPVN